MVTLSSPPGPGKEQLGDHTNARVTFQRALERGNLVMAEVTARELGRLDLSDALELTALIALRDRERGRRAAMCGVGWLEEREPSLDAALVLFTGAWLLFSLTLLVVFSLAILIHGASTVELLGFLMVWLVPTFLLSRLWRKGLWHRPPST